MWAKKHKHAILDGLELYHFLGESKFNLFTQMDGNIVGEGAKSIFEPACAAYCQIWRGSIMIWGCMGWDKVSSLCLIEGIMDEHVYHKILETKLINTMHMQDLEINK